MNSLVFPTRECWRPSVQVVYAVKLRGWRENEPKCGRSGSNLYRLIQVSLSREVSNDVGPRLRSMGDGWQGWCMIERMNDHSGIERQIIITTLIRAGHSDIVVTSGEHAIRAGRGMGW